MAPLAVDPEALDGAGAAVVSAGESLGSVISTLTAALSGTAGMAGDDPAGGALGRSYDSSASKLLEAMAVTRNGLCSLGGGVRTSAYNYSVAEAMSNIAGHGDPLPVPPSTGSLSAGSAPSAVGNGSSAPAGWGWVAKYIGMIWPTGDSVRLRTAAAAWSAAGTQFLVNEKFGVAGSLGVVRGQQIPEGEAIAQALTDADHGCTTIDHQCATIATQLSAYAAKIDQVHAAILDLLARICDPLTGLKEVWDFLTGEDEDEIKKIANDIRTVVNNFTAEVDALRHQITALLSEATTVVTTMGGYTIKEFSHFAGEAVAFIGDLHAAEGRELFDFLKQNWNLSLVRGVIDPQGSAQDYRNLVDGLAPLVGAGGQGAPGVVESWKEFGKQQVNWDDWAQGRYAEALAGNELTAGMLLLPGGPGSKLLRGLRDVEKLPELSGQTLRGPAPPHVPGGEKPPSGGRPAPVPPAKPTPVPPGSPALRSPTETKPMTVERLTATEPPTVPAAKPSAESPHAPVSLSPAAHLPTAHAQPHEAVRAGVSASPAEHPGGLPAATGHPSHVAPAEVPSAGVAPSTPVAHSPAVDGHPLKSRLPLDGGSPGDHPPHSSPRHDGVPARDPHDLHSRGDGPPGEHDHGDRHDYLPEPYAPGDVAVDAAHRAYERATAAEREISPAVVDAVRDTGGHLERFESRLKEIDSLARKLDGKLADVGPFDFEEIRAAENGINDAVRYTAVVPENGYWGHGDAVIKALEERGFVLKEDPASWKVPDVYRGRNLTFQTPDGMQFEVQVHTGDSLSAAEQTHRMYEERRLPTTALERRAELEALEAEIFNSVPIPDGTPLEWRDP
jgi:hypothetical protein